MKKKKPQPPPMRILLNDAYPEGLTKPKKLTKPEPPKVFNEGNQKPLPPPIRIVREGYPDIKLKPKRRV